MESKRLYRSRRQSVISGVCGGIGEYFNIDPVLIRVLWIVIGISVNGTGILFYIIASIVIPKEPKKIKVSADPYSFKEKADNPEDKTSYNVEEPQKKTDDKNTVGMVIGLLLIFVGGFILVMNFFNINLNILFSLINFNYIRLFARLFAKYFWPICLILLGLLFLVKSK